jgi:hypothetical protein
MKSTISKLLGLAAFVALLAGCAGTYVLDNTVQSFSQLGAPPTPATYRYERLPSQQVVNQAELEALADTALFQAGFRRDDAAPRYSVQIDARLTEVASPWGDPWGPGIRWGFGFGRRHSHVGVMSPPEPPWYHREVGIVVRELSSNRVVYETRASNSGPWRDSARVLPAMFQAAMQGFPTPPAGPRVVNVQIPG